MSMTENARAYRARNLRYKRAALASMGFDFIRDELDEMRETCNTIHWWSDQDEETLLNALDGDEDDVWEFKMVFSDLEARADRLFEKIYELCRYEDNFGQTYDDCTVALIGNRYRTVGFDSFEEDYFSSDARFPLPGNRKSRGAAKKDSTESSAGIVVSHPAIDSVLYFSNLSATYC